MCWYWEWTKYLIQINTNTIDNPRKKLLIAIQTIVDSAMRQEDIDFVDEDILYRIVVAESTKAYYTKQVDEENKQGFFLTYKSLSLKIAEIIREVNADFAYPKALASTLLEMAKNHVYFAQHLPSLTDVKVTDGDYAEVKMLLADFAFKILDSPSIAPLNLGNGTMASKENPLPGGRQNS